MHSFHTLIFYDFKRIFFISECHFQCHQAAKCHTFFIEKIYIDALKEKSSSSLFNLSAILIFHRHRWCACACIWGAMREKKFNDSYGRRIFFPLKMYNASLLLNALKAFMAEPEMEVFSFASFKRTHECLLLLLKEGFVSKQIRLHISPSSSMSGSRVNFTSCLFPLHFSRTGKKTASEDH